MIPSVRHLGLKELNRELYKQTIKCTALRIDAKHVNSVREILSDDLLKLPRFPSVFQDNNGDNSKRLLILKTQAEENLSSSHELKDFHCESLDYDVVLDYSYWNADEILEATLPENIEITTAFETVGHIAHMNLRSEHIPYKSLIGQKNPRLKTVITKIGEIESEFRVFQMEVIAGESNFITQVKEENCIFEFDFSKVYWNSRLQNEHKRLVNQFSKTDLICDVFAGIGPFALPAAKKGCIVYANDLNPDSVKYLRENISKNKIPLNTIKVYNLDGREFIKKSLFDLNKSNSIPLVFDHYIMNLPAIAYQFLDAFIGLFNDYDFEFAAPTVHCYLFAKNEDPIEIVKKVLKSDTLDATAYNVRSVAPNKDMICVSFKIPFEILKTNINLKKIKRE